jgi:imidazolonepropionase-like amidohydrolase
MIRYAVILVVLPIILSGSLSAHDYIPGAKQDAPVLLVGGDVYTVSGGILRETDVLFEDGRITQIGPLLKPPGGKCEIIDVTGMRVYPGLIAPNTSLGLVEIGAVRATVDVTEVGQITPEVKAYIAYNPDSEILPTVRSNGITTAQVVPGGSMLRGRSCIMNLDGWTVEDAAEALVDGVHLRWPAAGIRTTWWERRTPEEQRKAMEEARRDLRKAFQDAYAYYLAFKADSTIEQDLRWHAMLPLFTGDLPLFVHANDVRQIEEAVEFCDEHSLRMILVGGKDAWRVADLLAEREIPVIYGDVHSMPMRQDEGYDITFKTPSLLRDAGVKFCIGVFSSWVTRNLPFQAGQAAAFGLTPGEALRAITLSTAEILGLDDDLGSIEVGKKATLIVSEGDILDPLGHRVVHMFIGGRKVDLDNKQKELYRKYRAKHYEP